MLPSALCLLISVCLCCATSDWLDPMDMRHKGVDECWKSLEKCKEMSTAPAGDTCQMYMSRFVNILLKSISPQDSDLDSDEQKLLSLTVSLSGRDLKLLRDFGSGSTPLVELDALLSRIFVPSPWYEANHVKDTLSSAKAWFSDQVVTNPTLVIIVLSGFFMFYFIWLIHLQSYRRASIIFSVVLFFIAFGFNWERKRQEKVIENTVTLKQHSEIPSHCEHSKMTVLDQFLYFFKSDGECIKYNKAAGMDPILSVPLAEVFSDTVSGFVFTPLRQLGSIANDNISSLTNDMYWPLSIVMDMLLRVLVVLLFFYTFYRLILRCLFSRRYRQSDIYQNGDELGGRRAALQNTYKTKPIKKRTKHRGEKKWLKEPAKSQPKPLSQPKPSLTPMIGP